ncbi:sirohydrochlorin chelatase [Rhodococcus sp. B50]|uniref:sirohydrochlorin chelatase n=1 Tax=Rhodococcus sp. B50 TaxID=2682847 RepID=UPI001BD4EEE7|nr:sirohydrochlorin chelatase [Rhodococcus sp. B50]MBS9371529.1 Sirohydrochlorin ferrochelatase [Rhodococcus sp. B50]
MMPLVAVAHGSRDPRSSRAVAAALDTVRAENPGLDVRLAFLDLNTPSVGQVLDALAADGHRQVAVVPLLLGSAFHARVDLPALLREARQRHPRLEVLCSPILGDDGLLVDAARDLITATGVSVDDPSVGVAVCAVGSRRPDANRATEPVVPRILAGTAWTRASACFATSAEPSVGSALGSLSRSGARTLVLAPWILAPGLLWDRACSVAESVPNVRIATTLTDHSAVAGVIAARYSDTVRRAHLPRVA